MSQVNELLQQAIGAYREQDLSRARKFLSQLQALAAEDPRVWHWSALCAEDDDSCRAALVRVINLDPTGPFGALARPRLATLIGRSESASLPPTESDAGHEPSTAAEPTQASVSVDPLDKNALRPGELIGGRFRIIELIGRGGFGYVYKARDLKTRTLCVVKQLIERGSLTEVNDAVMANIEREAKLLASLTNGDVPNVPRILDYIPEHCCLVMDYIKGDTLAIYKQRKGKGTLSEREALTLARDLCTTLVAIHSYTDENGVTMPLIHGDITPPNIMIGKRKLPGVGQRRIWLVDFGLAQTALGKAGLSTEPRRGAGTPGFVAPEQRRGQAGPRSDIYSLGMTLRTITTPPKEDSEAATGSASERRRTQTKQLRPPVANLIERMTHEDPSERPSAKALQEQLEQILDNTKSHSRIRGLSVSLAGTLLCAILAIVLLGQAALIPTQESRQGGITRSLLSDIVSVVNAPAVTEQGAGARSDAPGGTASVAQQGQVVIDNPPVAGVIEKFGSTDEWELISPTAVIVTIWAQAPDNSITLSFLDAQGLILDSDIDSGGNAALIHYSLFANQHYKLRVRALDEDSEYKLAVISHHRNHAGAFDDLFVDSVQANPPISVEEWLIQGVQGSLLSIQAQPNDDTLTDLIISVLSSKGELLMSAQTSVYWSPTVLDLKGLPVTGEYTVRVVALGNEQVNYTISINLPAEVNVNEIDQGELSNSEDVDWWVFTPPEDGWYTITAEPIDENLDITLEVLNYSGIMDEKSSMAYDSINQSGYYLYGETVREYLPGGKPVHIIVDGYDGSSGIYSLFAFPDY